MFIKALTENIRQEIKTQYAHPFKSVVGSLLTRRWSRKSRPLVYAAINELNVKPNDKILEVGYGRGDGLERLLDIVSEGEGMVFGYETSDYMRKVCTDRFAVELQLTNGILQLDMPFVQALMPYPTRVMDGIFHVNTYYFWNDYEMHSMCREFARILRPDRPIICTLDLKRLEGLARHGILSAADYDPVRYMSFLESTAFDDVHIEYRRIDANGNFVTMSTTNAVEIQLIRARRTAVAGDRLFDADDPMAELEREIRLNIAYENANAAGVFVGGAQKTGALSRSQTDKNETQNVDNVDGSDKCVDSNGSNDKIKHGSAKSVIDRKE